MTTNFPRDNKSSCEREVALAPGQSLPRGSSLFAFCSHGEKLPRQGGLPGAVQRVTLPLEVAPGQRLTHVDSYRRQTMHSGKVDRGVSELSQIAVI